MKKCLLSFLIAVLLSAGFTACEYTAEISGQIVTGQSEQQPTLIGQAPQSQPTGEPRQQQPGGGQPPGQQPGQRTGQTAGNYEPVELAVSSDLIDAIMLTYSGKSFKAGEVHDDFLEAILQSGQKAPSAQNAQPWHFTVIKNSEIAKQLVSRDYREGAAVIVVSGKPDERRGVHIAFDCALATQNMYLAAQSLGLGAHLYYSGVQNINNSMKGTLGIPDGYEAQIIMLIGYLDDSADAVTSASPRNPVNNNVNYVE